MTMTICIKKLVPAALQGVATTILSLGIFLAISSVGRAEDHERKPLRNLHDIKHIIVIYQENWSFDSLYGLFPGANGLANGFGQLAQVDVTASPPYSSLIYQTPSPLTGGATDPQFPSANGKLAWTVNHALP